MHYKILLVLIIAIAGAFFYLHTLNPANVDLIFNETYRYNVPATYLLIAGFVLGIILSVLNSLVADIRRFIKDLGVSRERKRRESAVINYRSGVSALHQGNPTKALSYFTKALEYDPVDLDIYLRLADAHKAAGELQAAVEILERGLMKIPASMELLLKLADLSADAGDNSRAEKAWRDIIKFDSGNRYALARLRDFKVSSGDLSEALELQKKLIATIKGTRGVDNTELLASEGELLKGLLYEKAVFCSEAEDSDGATSAIKEILKLSDSFIPASILLGEIYEASGDIDSAIRIWRRAFEAHPDPVFFVKLEDAWLKKSEPEKILDEYRQAAMDRPQDVELALLLGRFYLRIEMVDDAIEELERVKNNVEENYYLDLLLGEAYLRRGRTDSASEIFSKALGIVRDLPPPYICSSCGVTASGWSGRCRECRKWNTMKLNRLAPGPKAEQPQPNLALV